MAEEPSKPQSWWQTLPGILTAVAALITAVTGLIVALNQAGALPRRSSTISTSPTPSTTLSAGAPGEPAAGVMVSVNELEQRLKAANIMLSTGKPEDRERVRGYFTGPESPYQLLAVSCLQLMGNQRLKESGYLDMIDKHYTSLVGEKNYVSADGKLDLERVKEAMVKAQNEYHGDHATSFEEIVGSR